MEEKGQIEGKTQGQVLLTRTQAARRAGVSISKIRRMEGAEIDPIVIDGKHFFHIEDIDRHRRLSEGQVAGRAFKMFEEGLGIIDVIIELEQAPELIEKLHETWRRLTCSIVIRGAHGWKREVREAYPKLMPLTPYGLTQCLHVVHEDPENLKRWGELVRRSPTDR